MYNNNNVFIHKFIFQIGESINYLIVQNYDPQHGVKLDSDMKKQSSPEIVNPQRKPEKKQEEIKEKSNEPSSPKRIGTRGKFDPEDFVNEIEQVIPLINLLNTLIFSNDNTVASSNLTQALKKSIPRINLIVAKSFIQYLDKEKKGCINFSVLMEFIIQFSHTSEYPSIDEIGMNMAKVLVTEKELTMKEYLDNLSIQPNENIFLQMFYINICKPLQIAGKDAYYLYYKLSKGTVLVASHLINYIENFRQNVEVPELPEEEEKKELPPDLSSAVDKFYDHLFGAKAKRKISAEALFKIFNTDRNSSLNKIEFQNGLRRLKSNISESEIDAVIAFADKDNSNSISLHEFVEAVKAIKEKRGGGAVKADSPLDSGIEKIKNYLQENNTDLTEMEKEFRLVDEENEGVIPLFDFKRALRNFHLGLNELEINAISEYADKDKNKKIDYEEFTTYLERFEIKYVPKRLIRKKPADMVGDLPSASAQNIANIKILKEETNFYKLNTADNPIDKLANLVETPYPDFVLNTGKHLRLNKNDNKYMITIHNSKKSAILCAELLYRRLKEGEKYKDPEFGPTDTDPQGAYSIYLNGKSPGPGYVDPKDVYWFRPKEIIENPCFMDVEGLNAGDVEQGELGDCWFITALSLLASGQDTGIMGHLDQYLLERLETNRPIKEEDMDKLDNGLFPPIFHMYAKKGMYVIRFMKDYEWKYVIMDDRLPCRDSNVPIFAKSKSQKEFWVPFLEKAYAKLHGCYSSLCSGFIDEALSDLTGLIPEKEKLDNLKEEVNEDRKEIDDYWNKLKLLSNRVMLGCSASGSTEGQIIQDGLPTGVLSGHAYAILDLFEIKKDFGKGKSRLLRVRNPWGNTEWMGKWSDKSEQIENNRDKIKAHYSEIYQEKIMAKYNMIFSNLERWEENANDDGTFLICYRDWRELFTNVYVCRDLLKEDEYRGVRFYGVWTEENNGGTPIRGTEAECIAWAKNPHARITVKEVVEVFITVAQEDPRIKGKNEFPFTGQLHPFCFIVAKCDGMKKSLDRFNQENIEYLSPISNQREQSKFVKLKKAGNYVVIPSTKEAQRSGNFWVTVYYPTAVATHPIITFSDPSVRTTNLPKKIINPYEVAKPEFQKFAKDRKPYFIFSQIIDKGNDVDISLMIHPEEKK